MAHILDMNIRKVDLGSLVALDRLLAERSLSRVARDVGLSQPAMSHMLARIRRIFNDPLLVRDGSAMVLTAEGVELKARLEVALPELLALFSPTRFVPMESRTTFKLAITDHAGQVLLPRLLGELREQAPHVQISISVIPNRQTDLEELDRGQFDLRVGWLRSLPPHWHRRKLMTDSIVLIGAIDHPDLVEPLTIERFVALDHVALQSDRPIYPNLIDSYLSSKQLHRNVVAHVSHFSLVPSIIASTRMVAMLPRRLAEEQARLGQIQIVKPPLEFPDNDLSMAWHPRIHVAVEYVWLRKLIATFCKAPL
ncbi:LysR family transcriptional regulator [Novosphingobium sp. PP1Y]|uniref:LysR family transcriptional regulator n=1 Tax=Novosphingobium sp. PP1Y TaxID=702113 RepID=UPI0002F93EB7|nr:LysR family transcriptional regulator [Novosphingobium sp. PP1Y]